LAGAVRPEQREEIAFPHRQVDALEGLDSGRVTLPQFLDDQCVHVVGRARTHEAAILMGAEAKRAPVTTAGPPTQVRPPLTRAAGRRTALPDGSGGWSATSTSCRGAAGRASTGNSLQSHSASWNAQTTRAWHIASRGSSDSGVGRTVWM